MKFWSRPQFALLALLAMFATLLPQFAWSCPMTGRIGSAATVCVSQQKMSCNGCCKSKSAAAPHSCCRSMPAIATAQTAVPQSSKVCAHVGDTCCKLVRLTGETVAPNGQTASSLLTWATAQSIATGPLPLADAPSLLLGLAEQEFSTPPFLPPRSYLEAPTLLGRAPPLS